MPRKALPATKKAQLISEAKAELYDRAVTRYQEEQAKLGPDSKPGLRTVCTAMEEEYVMENPTHDRIHLCHNTLSNLLKGGISISQFNEQKRWLVQEEEEEIIQYILELAEWGWPFSYSRIKEHANQLARARIGDTFPESGVGREWPYRFVERHSDRLHSYRPRPLDSVRGQAVNENMNTMYFDMAEEVMLRGDHGGPIAAECTWAFDETGFQHNGGSSNERVIGGTGKKVQYQQQDASRETITVLLTIGADGSALAPSVIFSGKAFQIKWLQDNPTKAK